MINIPNIYFDEAGNTGDNLLDADQPVYCLLATCLSEENVNTLLDIIKSKATELHFKVLKKSKASQRQILQILNNDIISIDTVKCVITDKEYAVVAHMVDKLIEPVLYRRGHDGYQSGLLAYLANFLYLLGKYEWGQERLARLTTTFQKMIRIKSTESINDFYTAISTEYDQASNNIKWILDLIGESFLQIKYILQELGKYELDLSLTSFSILCDHWGRQINKPFNVIHDDSKQIDFWKTYIDFVSSQGITPKEVGFGEKTIRFPLSVNDLRFADSKLVRQLQLADILVSSVRYAVTEIFIKKSNDPFARELTNSKLLDVVSYRIWPDLDVEFPDMNRKGVNVLDYLAGLADENPETYELVLRSINKHRE